MPGKHQIDLVRSDKLPGNMKIFTTHILKEIIGHWFTLPACGTHGWERRQHIVTNHFSSWGFRIFFNLVI